MTSTATRQRPVAPARTSQPGRRHRLLILTGVLSLAALLGPNLVADDLGMTMTMGMTHYMELLAVHQPLNLPVHGDPCRPCRDPRHSPNW
ncbi:MAG: hypothetical protein U0R79_10750 [Propionicimonas sp.]